jgi:hypothetical protein
VQVEAVPPRVARPPALLRQRQQLRGRAPATHRRTGPLAQRLVDDARHRQTLEKPRECRRGEPLRGNVEQLQGFGTGRVERGTARLGREPRVHGRGPDAAPRQTARTTASWPGRKAVCRK